MTTKFRIRSKSDKNVSIKLRLSISRKEVFEVNSGFFTNPKNWDSKKNCPKSNLSESKFLNAQLSVLNAYVNTQYVNDLRNIQRNTKWLQDCVDNCFGALKKNDESNEYFLEHLLKYISKAETKKVKGRASLGLSVNTVKMYTTFKNLIIIYERIINKKIKFSEIDRYFIESFTIWLLKEKKYSVNYAGKQLDHIKTICNDAEDYGIPVNEYSKKIEPFSENNDDRYIVTFTEEEIKKIWVTEMPNQSLENAKKWILLGCEIGQRGGDLLNIDFNDILEKNQNNYLTMNVCQKKTNKWVTVAFIGEEIIKIVEEDYPYKIAIQKLNEYIKIVCKICGINEIIKGKKYDKELKRKVLGEYPKHELISSHSFRRTFATRFYGQMETALIMKVTGHSRESQFMEYINKREGTDKISNLFIQSVLLIKAKKTE